MSNSRDGPFRVIPGFGLSLGFTIFYLALIVLIPLSAVFLKTFTMSWEAFWSTVTSERVMASYRLSFGGALVAAAINVVFGVIVAWVLVRYTFPGKRVVDALVDLPFALPTAVAGITLTALYYYFRLDDPGSAGVEDHDFSQEVNLIADYAVNGNLSVGALVATSFPGDAAEQYTGGDQTWSQMILYATVSF